MFRLGERAPTQPLLTSRDVWRVLARASFAVLSFVTSGGRPRSSGVMFAAESDRLVIVTAASSWKARCIGDGSEVAVTVPIRRGGLLSLIAPIPPATISFHARADVHPSGSVALESVSPKLARLVPPERRVNNCVMELTPSGHFLTYGLGVPLLQMAKPDLALARVQVDAEM